MLGRKVFVASAILSGGRLSMRFLDMITALVIARFLTPAEFGLVTLAIATLLMLRALTELPVSEALIRSERLTPEDVDTAFTLSLLRGLAVAALLAAAAWPMSWLYDDERLVDLTLALTLAPLAMALRSPRLVQFSRAVNYTPATLLDIGTKLAGFLCSVAIALAARSYWALIVGLLVPPLLAAPVSYIVAPYRPRLSLASSRQILSFAGWLTMARFVATANSEIDRFFIGGILGKAAVGYFAIGRSITTTATWAIGTPLMQAMFPGFAKIQSNPERLQSAYLKGQGMLVAAIMPLGFGMAMVAEPVVALTLGAQWGPVTQIIQVFAPVGAVATMTMPVQAVVLALGRPRQLVVRDLLMLLLGIPIVIIGALTFGLMGAVYARMLSGVIHTLLNLEILKRTLGLSITRQLANSWRSIVSVIVMIAALLVQQRFQMQPGSWHQLTGLLLSAVFGAGAYVATHLGLWLLAGRPAGPERFLVELGGSLWRRLFAGPQQEVASQ
jgi:lipopolysaccharide exporter